jgi:hypothetical protein
MRLSIEAGKRTPVLSSHAKGVPTLSPYRGVSVGGSLMRSYSLKTALFLSQSKEVVHTDGSYTTTIKHLGDGRATIAISQIGCEPFIRETLADMASCQSYLHSHGLSLTGWIPQELIPCNGEGSIALHQMANL